MYLLGRSVEVPQALRQFSGMVQVPDRGRTGVNESAL